MGCLFDGTISVVLHEYSSFPLMWSGSCFSYLSNTIRSHIFHSNQLRPRICMIFMLFSSWIGNCHYLKLIFNF
ncbi:hypothetical protein I3842_09G046700 [Carya illinoinensis]|uniref:Uncharacterized protein n=1 Tax=Carya illinoinensis TaxID=32201 RepID=A0A922J4L6_CARIL|nr:hypothetical protein I3842_09G046700 [Carya illinoinensis]